ncbi:hypothetical protein MTO96_038969 [Rhipicephalus appendiculatus]
MHQRGDFKEGRYHGYGVCVAVTPAVPREPSPNSICHRWIGQLVVEPTADLVSPAIAFNSLLRSLQCGPQPCFVLPCRDILCEPCRDDIIAKARLQAVHPEDGGNPRDRVCPLDGVPFMVSELATGTGYLDDVQEELVLCANIEHGCPCRDELRRLEEHLLYDCRYSPKTCNFCKKKNIPECELLLHTLSCALRPRKARVLRWR